MISRILAPAAIALVCLAAGYGLGRWQGHQAAEMDAIKTAATAYRDTLKEMDDASIDPDDLDAADERLCLEADLAASCLRRDAE